MGDVINVCTYTAACPGCGRPITWRSVHRKAALLGKLPQEVTEAIPGDCVHCEGWTVRAQLNRALNRRPA